MTEIFALDTPSLGDRSYLVGDGEVAFVVDPQRDIDRVLDLAARHRLRITDVFEAHGRLPGDSQAGRGRFGGRSDRASRCGPGGSARWR